MVSRSGSNESLRRSKGSPFLERVVFDVPVSPDYWREGARLVPEVAAARSKRLQTYDDLYHGVWESLGLTAEESSVATNYFADTARSWTNTLTAYPPDWDGLDPDYDPGLLNRALRSVVRSIFVFGTGVFYANPETREIEYVDPREWFPAGRHGDSIRRLRELPSTDGKVGEAIVTVLKLDANPVELTFKARRGTRAGELGELILERPITAEGVNERLIYAVPLDPDEPGVDWGSSIFELIIPNVTELTRRYSGASRVLTEHMDPVLTARRATGGGGRIPSATQAQRQEAEAVKRNALLANRRSGFQEIGDEWDSLEYVTWDASLDANAHQIDLQEDSVFATTGMPGPLQGRFRGGGYPSGITLQQSFGQTSFMIEALQHDILPMFTAALDYLRRGDVTPRWLNPLFVLDQAARGAQPDSDEDDAILTGENL